MALLEREPGEDEQRQQQDLKLAEQQRTDEVHNHERDGGRTDANLLARPGRCELFEQCAQRDIEQRDREADKHGASGAGWEQAERRHEHGNERVIIEDAPVRRKGGLTGLIQAGAHGLVEVVKVRAMATAPAGGRAPRRDARDRRGSGQHKQHFQ